MPRADTTIIEQTRPLNSLPALLMFTANSSHTAIVSSTYLRLADPHSILAVP